VFVKDPTPVGTETFQDSKIYVQNPSKFYNFELEVTQVFSLELEYPQSDVYRTKVPGTLLKFFTCLLSPERFKRLSPDTK
jgi:hypothetical protein